MKLAISLCIATTLVGVACNKDKASKPDDGIGAGLNLMKLSKTAKLEGSTNQEFPVGTTPWTPATACCAQVGKKCHYTANDWADPVWRDKLDFQLSEPGDYQYSYESNGKSFTARAIGDPGCQGKATTWEITGRMEGGTPVIGEFTRQRE